MTPQEFIESCDKLIHINPMWKWGEAKKPSYQNTYLPEKKQYIYADIISRQRLHQESENIEIEDHGDFSVI